MLSAPPGPTFRLFRGEPNQPREAVAPNTVAVLGRLAIGETRQSQNKKPDALEAYRVASGRYQSSYAAPLALLAESRLLAAEGKAGESKALLESIGTSYPEGPAAMVAAAELAAISANSGASSPGQ